MQRLTEHVLGSKFTGTHSREHEDAGDGVRLALVARNPLIPRQTTSEDTTAIFKSPPFPNTRIIRWLTLYRANVIAAVLHLVAIIVWFVIRFSVSNRTLKTPVVWERIEYNITTAGNPIPYTTDIATDDIATGRLEVDELYRVDIYLYAVIFSGLSLLAHLYVIYNFDTVYIPNLRIGRNPIQWIEYSASASIMMAAIIHLTGVVSLREHVYVGFLMATVMAFGFVMEVVNALDGRYFAMKRDGTRAIAWWPFIIGFGPFLPAWVFTFILIGQEDSVPTFVYAVVTTQLVAFSLFPLNQFLHYTQRWAKPRVPEKAALSYARSQLVVQFLSWQAKFLLPAIVLFGSLRELGPICYEDCTCP